MQVTQEHMASFDAYREPRLPDDLDLVQVVRDGLMKYGLKDKLEQFYDTDGYVQQAKTKRPEIQRYLLNIYLNLQLMMAERSSIEIRFSLLPAGDLDTWILIFDQRIAPFMADQNLPKLIL